MTTTTRPEDIEQRRCGSLAADNDAEWREELAGRDELIYLLAIGDVDRAYELVEEGHDVNVALEDPMLTPLVAAIESGCDSAVEWLLEAGAAPSLRVGAVEPVLMAAHRGQADVIERLLDAGANPNTAGFDAEATPLHLAVGAECLDCIEVLLGAGADLEAVNYSRTPLDNAAANGWLAGVSQLAFAGARSMQTALYDAIAEDQLAVVEFLVDEGADPGAPSTDPIRHGNTADALEWAIRVGAVQSEQFLIGNKEP